MHCAIHKYEVFLIFSAYLLLFLHESLQFSVNRSCSYLVGLFLGIACQTVAIDFCMHSLH